MSKFKSPQKKAPELGKKVQDYLQNSRFKIGNIGDLQKKVHQYMKEEVKGWPRTQRLSHAQFRYKAAQTEEEKFFWEAVIKANTQEPGWPAWEPWK